jgi:hypothetical protein
MTDDELQLAIMSLYDDSMRGVLGSRTVREQPVDVPQERRDRVRTAFLARGWDRKQRRLFVSRMIRDRFLSEEALAAGRDAEDIRMFMGWMEPLRFPENYPVEESDR